MAAARLDADRRLSPGGLRDLLAVVNSSRGLDEILEYLVVPHAGTHIHVRWQEPAA